MLAINQSAAQVDAVTDGCGRRDGHHKIVDFVGAGLADSGLSPLQS